MTNSAPWAATSAERLAKRTALDARNARLNLAGDLAEVKIGGQVGHALRQLMTTFYSTPQATYVDELVKAIIAEHGGH